jgi:mycofactocin precursor
MRSHWDRVEMTLLNPGEGVYCSSKLWPDTARSFRCPHPVITLTDMEQDTAVLETAATDVATEVAPTVAPQPEILVEEISIDGMCGVY